MDFINVNIYNDCILHTPVLTEGILSVKMDSKCVCVCGYIVGTIVFS